MKKLIDMESIEEVSTKMLKGILSDLNKGFVGTNEIGFFDRTTAKRYYIYNVFETDSSLCIREPSRAWPHSFLKHTSTKKYQRQLKDKIEKELERRA